MFKMNESIIVIQAEATNPNNTGVVFWSHDRGTAKLRMKLVRKNGIPQSLPEGTTVPIRLMFKSATAEGGYGKHDYLATVEDPVNGIVFIVLEDNILGYVGKVEGSVYIDFPNDRSLDTAGRFTFYIKRSPIDDSTPELEDYYFNGFSQTIDKIEKILADGKQEIEQKITESETQIDAKVKDTNDKITKANQDVATLNTDIDKANDRIDQTNQQISDLGKLKKMYSNSIDFGDYDYSGNSNLSAKLNASSFSSGTGATVEDDGDEIVFTLDGTNQLSKYATRAQTPVIEGKQYTISCEIMLETGFTGDPSGIRLQHAYLPGGNVVLRTTTVPKNELNKWQTLIGTQTVTYTSDAPNEWYPLFKDILNLKPSGKVRLKNIKIEEGDQATPYQPNLLDTPYYLSKVALGENIITSKSYDNSNYLIGSFNINKTINNEDKLTFTIQGTKTANKQFGMYILTATGAATEFQGHLTPVEGLTDVWSWSSVAKISQPTGSGAKVMVYQLPPESQVPNGKCTISWAKLEKGDTRTPNISQFKYFGEGLKDSNNPNDYSWDITPEYTEKALTNTLNLTDPQTALGLKNFKDGAQIDGVDVATVKNLGSVLQSGSGLTTIQSDKQSAFDEFSYEFERIGDRVFFHARVKTNSTTAVASHVNLLEIPLGFQFPVEWTIVGIPLSVVQWTTPQGEISALVITDSTGKQVVKFATNRVGNHYISGEWRTADSYPETK
ncbi:BppU family phage baseplate upper protein [Enterococcus lactis]|uniref:BppU family phage baseplate upper protein n=1 Tax=Enterococcus lactis TaxID=357441 RepID=UPI0024140DBE|nr:BppU family phage baseplate upper protein [Enterococcus lactis]MDG4634892.1 BppU family phage baseplate upper protein [Enterococcus lactis]MDG4637679.1 BppU family phage baseplate upper protein [Enterococcus lactis]